ncbi:hypothetical protein ACF0H5_013825 [Mactra antiquata]
MTKGEFRYQLGDKFVQTVEAYRKTCGLPLLYPTKKKYQPSRKINVVSGYSCGSAPIRFEEFGISQSFYMLKNLMGRYRSEFKELCISECSENSGSTVLRYIDKHTV